MKKPTPPLCALLLASGLALLPPVAAQAHDNAYLDRLTTPHNGQLRMSGAYHLELVVTPTALQLYVTDHAGTPSAVANAQAAALVLNGRHRLNLSLTPATDNRLEAAATLDPTQPTQAAVTLRLPGQAPLQARFDTRTRAPESPPPATTPSPEEHSGHH